MGERSRSLVGMTQGSRRRLALREALRRTGATGLTGAAARPIFRGEYAALRRELRVGERLRPCLAIEHEGTPVFCSHCDGSGVVPARRTQRGSNGH